MQLTPCCFFQRSIDDMDFHVLICYATNTMLLFPTINPWHGFSCNVLRLCPLAVLSKTCSPVVAIETSTQSSGLYDFYWNHVNKAMFASGCVPALMYLQLASGIPSELWAQILLEFLSKLLKVCGWISKSAAMFFFFIVCCSSMYCKIFVFS